MTVKPRRISKRWIQSTLENFREFLYETDFPDLERLGERGSRFLYPEWMIMFIAVLSVKLRSDVYANRWENKKGLEDISFENSEKSIMSLSSGSIAYELTNSIKNLKI